MIEAAMLYPTPSTKLLQQGRMVVNLHPYFDFQTKARNHSTIQNTIDPNNMVATNPSTKVVGRIRRYRGSAELSDGVAEEGPWCDDEPASSIFVLTNILDSGNGDTSSIF